MRRAIKHVGQCWSQDSVMFVHTNRLRCPQTFSFMIFISTTTVTQCIVTRHWIIQYWQLLKWKGSEVPGWVKHSILFSSPFPLLTHSSEKTPYVSPKRFVFCNSTFHHGRSIWLSTPEKANDCLVCWPNGGASDISCNAHVKYPDYWLIFISPRRDLLSVSRRRRWKLGAGEHAREQQALTLDSTRGRWERSAAEPGRQFKTHVKQIQTCNRFTVGIRARSFTNWLLEERAVLFRWLSLPRGIQ